MEAVQARRIIAYHKQKDTSIEAPGAKLLKPNCLLKLLQDMGLLVDGDPVKYNGGDKKKARIKIQGETAMFTCACCNDTMTRSRFDTHSGGNRHAITNIRLTDADNLSLYDCRSIACRMKAFIEDISMNRHPSLTLERIARAGFDKMAMENAQLSTESSLTSVEWPVTPENVPLTNFDTKEFSLTKFDGSVNQTTTESPLTSFDGTENVQTVDICSPSTYVYIEEPPFVPVYDCKFNTEATDLPFGFPKDESTTQDTYYADESTQDSYSAQVPYYGARYGSEDICKICGDGGDLIICDGCTSVYHTACVYLTEPPALEAKWYCDECSCKICQVRPEERPLEETGPLVACAQCRLKHHQGCIQIPTDEDERSKDFTFCTVACRNIWREIVHLLSTEMAVPSSSNSSVDKYSWSILNANCQSEDSKRERKEARSILRRSFNPVKDGIHGKDYLRSMLNCEYSPYKRFDFSNSFTVVLRKHLRVRAKVACVALVRIHGPTIAEMPFIATLPEYRKNGMCKMLVHNLQLLLRSWDVEKLSLIAAGKRFQEFQFGGVRRCYFLREGPTTSTCHGTTIIFPERLHLIPLSVGNPKPDINGFADSFVQRSIMKQICLTYLVL